VSYVLLCQVTAHSDVNRCLIYWLIYVLHLFYMTMYCQSGSRTNTLLLNNSMQYLVSIFYKLSGLNDKNVADFVSVVAVKQNNCYQRHMYQCYE